jgi:hypothetical protein
MKALALLTAAAVTLFSVAAPLHKPTEHRTARAKRRPRRRLLPKASATGGTAMAIGFVLGRIWQIRCHLEQSHER